MFCIPDCLERVGFNNLHPGLAFHNAAKQRGGNRLRTDRAVTAGHQWAQDMGEEQPDLFAVADLTAPC